MSTFKEIQEKQDCIVSICIRINRQRRKTSLNQPTRWVHSFGIFGRNAREGKLKIHLTRRAFLGVTSASVVGWQLLGCDDDGGSREGTDGDTETGTDDCWAQTPPQWEADTRIRYGEVKTTICPYCACGCGLITTTSEGVIVNIEGDVEHPVNRGSLCSKGAAISQLNSVEGEINPRRVTKPLYRAAGASEWQEVEWDAAVTAIAAKVKDSRDNNWTSTDSLGRTVNRTDAIACLGGAALDNEECYLLIKAMRAMGLVYIEHQARI